MEMVKSLLNTMKRNLEPRVHFHSGPGGEPMVCHDEHCDSPRLDV